MTLLYYVLIIINVKICPKTNVMDMKMFFATAKIVINPKKLSV